VAEGIESRTIPGPAIQFRCPACDAEDASATTFQYGERLILLHLIGISSFSEHNYVQCGQCRGKFVSSVSVFELPNYERDEIAGLLRWHVSPILVTLMLAGILFIPIPGAGLVLNGLLLACNWRRHRPWIRAITLAATILSGIVLLLFLLAYAHFELKLI
jgi:hypothetical protein